MSYYDKDEWKYPSVTTVISDCTDKSAPLTQWAANMTVEWIRQNVGQEEMGIYPTTDEHLEKARTHFRDVSQEALDVGSEVHNAIEKYLKADHWTGKQAAWIALKGQARSAFCAFQTWEKEHNLKPIALEQTVYGDCWAGTLDFIGYFDNKLYVIDWKSSAGFYPEMRYQVAAYRWALGFVPVEDCEVPHMALIEGCGILRLDKKTGIPKFHDTSKSYERDIAVFKAMVKLYFSRHPVVARRAGWKTPF
uniref:Putative PD-(D/E)XK nuclease superfamily protein n=1 Tax=viral metagenome TaxID=1070528 RepID=A0A6M3Y0C1_9ZZZZ